MHRGRPRTLGAALLVLVALLLAAPAQAHDYLVGSSPESGAALDTPPTEVTLEFNTSIGQKFAQVAVVGPDGTPFTSGEPTVDGAVVTQAVEAIPAGTDVTISYRVVSSDGHPIGGTVPFSVTTAASAATPPDTGASQSDGDAVAPTPTPAPSAPAPSAATTEDDVNPTAASDTGGATSLLPWLGLLFVVAATVAGVATFAISRRRRGTT